MCSSFAVPHFGHVITESRIMVFCYCTALNPFGADGYPALVVAAVNALMLVLASSNVTMAVLSLNETSALATPGTPRRLFFTIKGQSAQYIFLKDNVLVISYAMTTNEDTTSNTKNSTTKRLS